MPTSFILIALFYVVCEANKAIKEYKLDNIHTDKVTTSLEIGEKEPVRTMAVSAVTNQLVFYWWSVYQSIAKVGNRMVTTIDFDVKILRDANCLEVFINKGEAVFTYLF